MFKTTLLMSSLRQCFCLLAAGILLAGQLPVCPRSFAVSSVAELNSLVSAAPAESFIGEVNVDDNPDFLLIMVAGISVSMRAKLPLQYFSSLLLLSATEFSASPLARPPPVNLTC